MEHTSKVYPVIRSRRKQIKVDPFLPRLTLSLVVYRVLIYLAKRVRMYYSPALIAKLAPFSIVMWVCDMATSLCLGRLALGSLHNSPYQPMCLLRIHSTPALALPSVLGGGIRAEQAGRRPRQERSAGHGMTELPAARRRNKRGGLEGIKEGRGGMPLCSVGVPRLPHAYNISGAHRQSVIHFNFLR